MPKAKTSEPRILSGRVLRNIILSAAFALLSIYTVSGQVIIDLSNVPCTDEGFNEPAVCDFIMECVSPLFETTIVAQSTADFHCPNNASIVNTVAVVGGVWGLSVQSSASARDFVSSNTIALSTNSGHLYCDGTKTPWNMEYHYEYCTPPGEGGGGGGEGGDGGGYDPCAGSNNPLCQEYCFVITYDTCSRECNDDPDLFTYNPDRQCENPSPWECSMDHQDVYCI